MFEISSNRNNGRLLYFYSHIEGLRKKASQKLFAFSRIGRITKSTTFRYIMKSQFSYCPLVWMFCSRTFNNAINKIHERALRITTENNTDSFVEQLLKYQDATNHHKNIHILMTKQLE